MPLSDHCTINQRQGLFEWGLIVHDIDSQLGKGLNENKLIMWVINAGGDENWISRSGMTSLFNIPRKGASRPAFLTHI